jgi:CRP/FNR family transcriptional regulator, nitrogen fixation regulation protein
MNSPTRKGLRFTARKTLPNMFIRSRRALFEATNCSRMVGARLVHFTWSVIFLGWRMVAHRFTAEAVIKTTVHFIRRRTLETAAEGNTVVARNLLGMTTSNLEHAENHMLLLGRKTSLERVAAFLLEMDRRLTGARVMALPMSRQDIADYLGLTLETVSRALSRLHQAGLLDFNGHKQREIVLRDRQRLVSFDLPA